MLKPYDPLEAIKEEKTNPENFFEKDLHYFASEVMETLGIEDPVEMTISLGRAFKACSALHIPFSKNFKRVYSFNGRALIADWKISSLACYLIIINCDPAHAEVAKAQLYFASHHL